MENSICSTNLIFETEKIILNRLAGQDLWGDINLSKEEYGHLKEVLKGLLEKKHDIIYICNHHPVAITTFLVFLARYDYNTNFWGLVEDSLDIQINPPTMSYIGMCARSTFEKNGFDYSDVKDERRVNIEPILYEAGRPPESCLNDLFYILKYSQYRVFDPSMIIDDLTEARSYRIRKPMRKFLARSNEERAVGFVLDVHDAMLAIDQSLSTGSPYVDNYAEWKSNNAAIGSKSAKKRNDVQAKPFLNFEHGKKGLCITLPYCVINEEWLDYVQWNVICDEKIISQKVIRVLGDQGRRYIEPISIQISPNENYTITLNEYYEDLELDKTLNKWELSGIPYDGALLFSSSGRLTTSSYFPMPYCIMVLGSSAEVVETKDVNESYQYYPTNNDKYEIILLESLSRNASVTFLEHGKIKTMAARPQVELRFIGDTLFSLSKFNGNLVFTSIPQLHIYFDQENPISNVELVIGDKTINIDEYFEDDNSALIDLSKIIKARGKKFGTYSVKLYVNGRFIKQNEFSLSPKIKTDYSSVIPWPSEDQRNKRRSLRFEKSEMYDIEFKDTLVKNDELRYLIDSSRDAGRIQAAIKIDDGQSFMSFDIELPINPFKLSLLDSNGDILENITSKPTKLGISDIDENILWVGIETYNVFCDYKYLLRVKSIDGILQEEKITLTKQGQGNINLSVLYDSIRNSVLPVSIDFVCIDTDESANIINVYNSLDLPSKPKHQAGQGVSFIVIPETEAEEDLMITRYGLSSESINLSYSNSSLSKVNPVRGYRCERLEEGLYVVETNKNKDFIFEYDNGVELTHNNSTIYIPYGKNRQVSNISLLLGSAISHITVIGPETRISSTIDKAVLQKIIAEKNKTLNVNDYEKLIALADLSLAKCSRAKKASIIKLMRWMSQNLLSDKDRLEIIRMLIKLNVKDETFEVCLSNYDLLFCAKGSDDSKNIADNVEIYSTELSLLLKMGNMDSLRSTIGREKYREIVGKDAILKLITVDDEEDPRIIAEAQKQFLREQKPCNATVNLTSEISGDEKDIQSMTEFNNRSGATLNLSKKPDVGVYFAHIRYIDRYINWYNRSYDKNGDVIGNVKDLMIKAVKNYTAQIDRAMKEAMKVRGFAAIAIKYEEALRKRYRGRVLDNLGLNIINRYFYVQGIAAFLAAIPYEYSKNNVLSYEAKQFMMIAKDIAPSIAMRDYLMASTYIYLKRKEIEICQ